MSEIDRDIDGMKSEATPNSQFVPAAKVSLDEKGKSFVYDFEEPKEIQKIELFKTNLEKKSRIRERDLHIYTKQNETDGWTELTPDNWNYEVDSKNQSIHFNLKETLKTRFIKIRTIWDDRDIDNKNVSDYVTFSNDSVQKMIRIWTLDDKRNEAYAYDKNSNRFTLTENGNTQKYQYYKNEKNGNTARVMSDGKWWYTYDANGNRTARASNAVHNNNEVTLDKTGEYWEYTWDYHNRLVKVQQFNAPDTAQNVVVEYDYDALNRRIERTSRTKAEAEVIQYAYGRNGAITYRKKENSEVSRTFAYLNNQITAFLDKSDDGTEKLYYTVTDIQGSVTEVYDEEGFLVWKSGYTAFGIKAGETTNLIDFNGLYTGCDYDAETGLTYHWNRWRSEDGSNWLSEDPAHDGLNWYGYAGQNPTNYIDRNGLKKDKAGGSKSNKEKGVKNNQSTPDEDPHITSSSTQNKETVPNISAAEQFIAKEIDGKVVITVDINNAEQLDAVVTGYLVVWKDGTLGFKPVDTIALTDSNGNIIHTFSNDAAVKQYANYRNPSEGNFSDMMGDVSSATGIIGDVIDSSSLGNISVITGAVKTYKDIKKWEKSKNLDNTTNLFIDGIGFIPSGGAFASIVLSETKDATEQVIDIEKEYQKTELINAFSPSNNKNIDYGHMFIKELKYKVHGIFKGN